MRALSKYIGIYLDNTYIHTKVKFVNKCNNKFEFFFFAQTIPILFLIALCAMKINLNQFITHKLLN